MLRNRIPTLLLSIGISAAAVIPAGSIRADDTEIYLTTSALIDSSAQPNVLIVLDTSGSMSSTDGTSPAVSRMDRMKDGLNQLLDAINNVNIGLMRFHYRGGPVLYPVADINADVCDIEGGCTAGASASSSGIQIKTNGIDSSADDAEESLTGTVTLNSDKLDIGSVDGATTETEVTVRITSSADDVEEQFSSGSTGSVSTGSSDLELFKDGSTQQVIGVHFAGIEVDPGVTITSAFMTFTYDSSPGDAGTLNADISVHASDDSPDFATSADINGRTTTGTSVNWNDTDIGAASATEDTSDIKTLVQAIVNRAGWATGNAMAFILKDNVATPTTGVRRFETRNASNPKKPTLTIGCTPECKAGGATDTLITIGVSGNDGDAEQSVVLGGSTLDTASSDLELVQDSGNAQLIGLRFPGVAVPNGATIVSASIEFEIDEQKGGEADLVDLDVYAESGAGGRGVFSTGSLPSARTRTAARADWDDLPNTDVDGKMTSSDLSAVVQEVVNNAGWASGEAMVFIIEKDPDSTSSGNRTVESLDGEAAAAPKLTVKYATGGGGPTTNKLGLRFAGVRVPQGSTITEAYIDFTGGAANAEATLIKVHGHDVDDSPTFTTTASDIGARVKTSVADPVDGVVAWNAGTGLDDWGVNTVETTPDLKKIVQQIVNRTGWCGGNALGFILDVDTAGGSLGKRTGFSYDDDPTKAPVLRVSYDADSPQAGANNCDSSTIYAQPDQSADDAEEHADGTMDLASSDLELTLDGDTQVIGMRFDDLPIPQGATIVSADLTFTVDEVGSDATTLTIDGELTDDSAAFSSTSGNITSRTKTSASKKVTWSTSSTPALASWTTVNDKHVTPDLKAIVQEIVDQAGWTPGNALSFIVSGTGKRVAKSIDGDAGNSPRLRVSFQGEVAEVTVTVRDRLHDIVDALVQRSGTPVLGAMVEAARYYRGEDVFYGLQRGVKSDSDKVTRVSHAASYTGGTHNLPAGCPSTDSSDVSCKTETISGTATYKSPITLACQESYIVLMTDGDGYITGGETGAADPIPLTNAITGGSCSNHDDCVKELVTHLNGEDQITSSSQVLAKGTAPLEDEQNVHTYTVGFASDGDPTFLQALATLGEGEFKTADSADSLAAAFNDIIASILKTTTSLAAPSLTVNAFNRLFHRDEVYFSLFEPDNNVLWPGNVKKYNICSDPVGQSCELGEILDADLVAAIGTDSKIKIDARSEWGTVDDGREIKVGGGGDQIPVNSSRKIYTDVGSSGVLTGLGASPVALGSSNEILTTNQKVRDQICADPTAGNTACDNLISWIRGVDLKDEDGDTSTTDERWKLQDPLHSSPVAITYGGTATDPIDKVFVGSNDGTIRMLNGKNGKEEWAFIPASMLDDQQTLFDNPEADHIYGLDVTPSFLIVDQDFDGIIEPGSNDYDGTVESSDGDFVYMFVAMRRGGRNIYAFDVTPSATLTDPASTTGITPKFMWRIEGGTGDYEKLGLTFSKPIVTDILVKTGAPGGDESSPKTVLIFGGGYDAQFDDAFGTDADTANEGLDMDGDSVEENVVGNAIYIVDPDNGSRIRWFSSDLIASPDDVPDIRVPGMYYPIPSDLAVFDSNGDGESDRIYVGDVGGNIWRIDLDDQISASQNGDTIVGRLAKLSTTGTASEERRFFHSPDVVQVQDANFSSTARYDLVTIGSGYRAHPLETAHSNRMYAIRDFDVDGMTDVQPTGSPDGFAESYPDAGIDVFTPNPIVESDLVDVTDNKLQDGSTAEADTTKTLLQASRGWLLDLTGVGEKVLARPVVLAGKLFFTTFLPEAESEACEAQEGGGLLYAVDVLNAVAVINFDDSGTDPDALTKSDRTYTLGGGIPSPPVPIFQEKGVTLLVGSGGGAATVDPEINLPRERTFWYQH